MRPRRFGLALRGDHAVGVETVRGVAVRAVECERREGESLIELAERALDELRGASRSAARLGVSVSDLRGRAGALYGVDAAEQPEQVAELLQSTPEAFFIGARNSLAAGNVWRTDTGWCGVVIDREVADGIAVSVAGTRTRILGIAIDEPHSALSELATSASALDAAGPRIVDISFDIRQSQRQHSRRTGLAIATVLFGIWALVAPNVGRLRQIAELERGIDRAVLARDGLRAELARRDLSPDLILATRALASESERIGNVLAALARGLPDSSAIVSLRVSERSGALVVISTNLGDAIAAASEVPELSGIRITGVVSREPNGDADLQRATLTWGSRRGPLAPGLAATGGLR